MTTVAKPFLSFYESNNIIPVHQDTSDIELHFSRRDYLYRTLGIPPHFLKGKSVIEFGPGTGDNAMFVDHHEPAQFQLVDANAASIAALKAKLDHGSLNRRRCTVIESDFTDFSTDQTFDLVICEACVSGQNTPRQVLQTLARFCTPGGILVTTTNSEVSLLSEMCRQVFRPAITTHADTFAEQVELSAQIFGPHLDTLMTGTRSAEDWVVDNILHDWHGVNDQELLSIPDALTALARRFQLQSSSPRFVQDFRWYKSIANTDTIDQQAHDSYRRFVLALIDYRVDAPVPVANLPTAPDKPDLQALCKKLSEVRAAILRDNNYTRLPRFVTLLRQVQALLPAGLSQTSLSIDDFIIGIQQLANGDHRYPFSKFKHWWGRGQQYVSFVRTG